MQQSVVVSAFGGVTDSQSKAHSSSRELKGEKKPTGSACLCVPDLHFNRRASGKNVTNAFAMPFRRPPSLLPPSFCAFDSKQRGPSSRLVTPRRSASLFMSNDSLQVATDNSGSDGTHCHCQSEMIPDIIYLLAAKGKEAMIDSEGRKEGVLLFCTAGSRTCS